MWYLTKGAFLIGQPSKGDNREIILQKNHLIVKYYILYLFEWNYSKIPKPIKYFYDFLYNRITKLNAEPSSSSYNSGCT